MSAIAGIWSFDGRLPVSVACRSMLRPLSLYGPDDIAQYADSSIAVGRCLLRLLPEDDFDAQPLSAAGVEHEVHVYPSAPHSFFDRRAEEHAEASEDAWRRMLGFLDRYAAAG